MSPKDFQQSLKNAGFDPVRIDGQWGPTTANACKQWFESGKDIEVVTTDVKPETPATVVPLAWMPVCHMERIIVHWTAGSFKASENDCTHYHVLVEGDGDLIKGTKSIKDNTSTKDGVYAAHTRGANSASIGISACAMAGAIERPFDAGRYPLQQEQWDMLARIAADLCRRYEIAVTPQTVLQHGEVQANLGIPQLGKWDITKLPWEPTWQKPRVGDDFRARVKSYLKEA